MVAWEFCYRISDATSVTFYPGIWKIGDDNTDYELVHSNNVTYNSSIQTNSSNNIDSCQRVNLSTIDQFTAPARSIVGLYSNVMTQLLHTNNDSSITTYRFSGNQSSGNQSSGSKVIYNIAIRVHLGEMLQLYIFCV